MCGRTKMYPAAWKMQSRREAGDGEVPWLLPTFQGLMSLISWLSSILEIIVSSILFYPEQLMFYPWASFLLQPRLLPTRRLNPGSSGLHLSLPELTNSFPHLFIHSLNHFLSMYPVTGDPGRQQWIRCGLSLQEMEPSSTDQQKNGKFQGGVISSKIREVQGLREERGDSGQWALRQRSPVLLFLFTPSSFLLATCI